MVYILYNTVYMRIKGREVFGDECPGIRVPVNSRQAYLTLGVDGEGRKEGRKYIHGMVHE
jgi:hypothetical protein